MRLGQGTDSGLGVVIKAQRWPLVARVPGARRSQRETTPVRYPRLVTLPLLRGRFGRRGEWFQEGGPICLLPVCGSSSSDGSSNPLDGRSSGNRNSNSCCNNTMVAEK